MVKYKYKQYNLDTMFLEECDIPTVKISDRLDSIKPNDNTIGDVFRIEFSEPMVIKTKKNRKISLYKENKSGIHTTIKGKGCVGKLIKE
jgi:hypothetical protein